MSFSKVLTLLYDGIIFVFKTAFEPNGSVCSKSKFDEFVGDQKNALTYESMIFHEIPPSEDNHN